ncbi:MAG: S-layer protein [Nanoarchaeota archaeon]|nr:S-layer protein [Nanoarchaeota archaeon]MBU4451518.1 S-layer protein [Nanoarchaeota archaeon]
MQLKIKQIGSTLMGAVMTGATLLGGALAADISDFQKMGPSDTVVVVGASAATADVVGAINVGATLYGHGVTATSGAGAATTVVDGGVALFDSTNQLLLNSKMNVAKDTVTANELPVLLKKSTFTNEDGTNYDYSQSIVVGSYPYVLFGQTASGTDPVMHIKLSTSTSSPIYTLKADFTKAVPFNATASKGQSITLFGMPFTVGSETDGDTLVLYKSASDVSVGNGEQATVTVGATEYTITVRGFDTTNDAVILEIGGVTNSVKEGVSKKIGGVSVYAKTVSSWDNGNKGLAVLQVGSEKITLETGQAVTTGDSETAIDGTLVTVTGGISALTSLEIKVAAKDSDSDEIISGKEFVDPFTGTIKISYTGVSSAVKADNRDQIKLRNSGDYKGYVTFKDANGKDATVYFVRGSETSENTFALQDDTDNNKILLVEGATAVKNDTHKETLFLAPGDSRYTHMVKVNKIYNTTSKGYVEFTDVISGATYTTQESSTGLAIGTGITLTVDGKNYVVTPVSSTSVNVTYADSKTVVYPTIRLANGEELAITAPLSSLTIPNNTVITLPTGDYTYLNETVGLQKNITAGTNTAVTYTLTSATDSVLTGISIKDVTTPAILIVEEKDKDSAQNAVVVSVKDGNGITSGNSYVAYNAPTMNGSYKSSSSASDKVTAYLDLYGTYAELDTSSDNHAIVTLYYPDTQMTSNVYLLAASATAPTTAAGTGNVVLPSLGSGISKLDTEISAERTSKNLILVGGPYANALVNELAEQGKTPTKAEWSAKLQGKAIIQAIGGAFDPAKTAIVVAGWTADDTRIATLKLATADLKTFKGTIQQQMGGVWSAGAYPFPVEAPVTTNSTD